MLKKGTPQQTARHRKKKKEEAVSKGSLEKREK